MIGGYVLTMVRDTRYYIHRESSQMNGIGLLMNRIGQERHPVVIMPRPSVFKSQRRTPIPDRDRTLLRCRRESEVSRTFGVCHDFAADDPKRARRGCISDREDHWNSMEEIYEMSSRHRAVVVA